MSIVDLDTVKKHLRVSSDDEGTLIALYMSASQDYIVKYLDDVYLGTEVPEVPVEVPVIDANDIPAPIKAAYLLLIGDMFENRQAQTEKTFNANPAVLNLLYPYRKNIGV